MKKKQNLNKKMGDTELCFKCDRAPCDRSMLRMAPASKKKIKKFVFCALSPAIQRKGKECDQGIAFYTPKNRRKNTLVDITPRAHSSPL